MKKPIPSAKKVATDSKYTTSISRDSIANTPPKYGVSFADTPFLRGKKVIQGKRKKDTGEKPEAPFCNKGQNKFTYRQLKRYMNNYIRKGKIEDNNDSDDKARAIVGCWKRSDKNSPLNSFEKVMLIKEMFSGDTHDEDENAILDLLKESSQKSLDLMFGKYGLTMDSLNYELDGEENDRLWQFYKRRQAKYAIRKTVAESTKNHKKKGNVNNKSFKELGVLADPELENIYLNLLKDSKNKQSIISRINEFGNKKSLPGWKASARLFTKNGKVSIMLDVKMSASVVNQTKKVTDNKIEEYLKGAQNLLKAKINPSLESEELKWNFSFTYKIIERSKKNKVKNILLMFRDTDRENPDNLGIAIGGIGNVIRAKAIIWIYDSDDPIKIGNTILHELFHLGGLRHPRSADAKYKGGKELDDKNLIKIESFKNIMAYSSTINSDLQPSQAMFIFYRILFPEGSLPSKRNKLTELTKLEKAFKSLFPNGRGGVPIKDFYKLFNQLFKEGDGLSDKDQIIVNNAEIDRNRVLTISMEKLNSLIKKLKKQNGESFSYGSFSKRNKKTLSLLIKILQIRPNRDYNNFLQKTMRIRELMVLNKGQYKPKIYLDKELHGKEKGLHATNSSALKAIYLYRNFFGRGPLGNENTCPSWVLTHEYFHSFQVAHGEEAGAGIKMLPPGPEQAVRNANVLTSLAFKLAGENLKKCKAYSIDRGHEIAFNIFKCQNGGKEFCQ